MFANNRDAVFFARTVAIPASSGPLRADPFFNPLAAARYRFPAACKIELLNFSIPYSLLYFLKLELSTYKIELLE